MAVLQGNPLLLTTAPSGDADSITKSFRSDNNETKYIYHPEMRAGNRTCYTISVWHKRDVVGSRDLSLWYIWGMGDTDKIWFQGLDSIRWWINDGSTAKWESLQTFTDTASWYNFQFVYNSTEALSADRMKVYCNGKRLLDTNGSETSYPTRDNDGASTGVGTATTRYWGAKAHNAIGRGLWADCYFIDGRALNPSSFGEFDDNQIWQWKKFNLPQPNANTTWSTSAAPTTTGSFHASGGADKMFDGHEHTSIKSSTGNQTITWTPTTPIPFTQSVYANHRGSANETVATITLPNGNDMVTDVIRSSDTNGNVIIFEGKGKLKQLKITATGGNDEDFRRLFIDGQCLIDGRTDDEKYLNYNDGTTWSDQLSAPGGTNDITTCFDGKADSETSNTSNGVIEWDIPSNLQGKRLEIYIDRIGTDQGNSYFKINNVDQSSLVETSTPGATHYKKWVDLGTSVTEVKWGGYDADNKYRVFGFRVDGTVLIDNTYDNSENLKFNNTTTNGYIGLNSFAKSVNDMTAAIPILKTEDQFGAVTDGTYNSDSSAGTTDGTGLVLALPMNGDWNDVHHLINTGSSQKTLTPTGAAGSNITRNYYDNWGLYGKSVNFLHENHGNQNLALIDSDFAFGTGAWTIEFWIYWTGNNSGNTDGGIFEINAQTTAGQYGNYSSSGMSLRRDKANERFSCGIHNSWFNTPTGTYPDDRWIHLALVHDGSQVYKMYLNGKAEATLDNSSGTALDITATNFVLGGYYGGHYHHSGQIQDLRMYKGVAKYSADFNATIPNLNKAKGKNLTASLGIADSLTSECSAEQSDDTMTEWASPTAPATRPLSSRGLSFTCGSEGNRKKFCGSFWMYRFADHVVNGVQTVMYPIACYSETNETDFFGVRISGNGGGMRIGNFSEDSNNTFHLEGGTQFPLGVWRQVIYRVDTTDTNNKIGGGIENNSGSIWWDGSGANWPSLNQNSEANSNNHIWRCGRRSGHEYPIAIAGWQHYDGQWGDNDDFGSTTNGKWVGTVAGYTVGTNGFNLYGTNSANPGVDYSSEGNDFNDDDYAYGVKKLTFPNADNFDKFYIGTGTLLNNENDSNPQGYLIKKDASAKQLWIVNHPAHNVNSATWYGEKVAAGDGSTGALTDIDLLKDVPVNSGEDSAGTGGEVSGNYPILDENNLGIRQSSWVSGGGLTSNGTTNQSGYDFAPATFGCWSNNTDGYYWEMRAGSTQSGFGIYDTEGGSMSQWSQAYQPGSASAVGTAETHAWSYFVDSIFRFGEGNYNSNFDGDQSSVAAGDYFHFALKGNKWWFGKNGKWMNAGGSQGNPSAGTNPTYTFTTNRYFIPFTYSLSPDGSARTQTFVNFGQKPFKYTMPTGFKTLNTTNMADSTVPVSAKGFKVKTWLGDGEADRKIDGLEFQPEIAIVKSRTADQSWQVTDVNMTAAKNMHFDVANAEGDNLDSGLYRIKAFNSDGIQVGGRDEVNKNGETHVGYFLDAGTSAATVDDSGTITPDAQWVDNNKGISVTEYTGTGSAGATVGTGLTSVPDAFMVKRMSGSSSWMMYWKALGNDYYHTIDGSAAKANAENPWNDTDPSNSIISLGSESSVNGSSDKYLLWAFVNTPGFSRFGKYTGNGNSIGPLIHCDFQPSFVMIKDTGDSSVFQIFDSDDYQEQDNRDYIRPDVSDAESTSGQRVGLLSNGVKIRSNDGSINSNDVEYVFWAFAKNPLKTTRAT